jgi:hypothetical protein
MGRHKTAEIVGFLAGLIVFSLAGVLVGLLVLQWMGKPLVELW